ncbi:BRCA2 and CDKN1A-interacting protein [Myotis davidii]|uniref:BRCA2 and CDKN1A-interacting protein n=1 Tax=Myotis davidii TaxID=225400 RepID=L5MDW6_MYODS|nr:BRCA2 and CDKN1A-interacting protein [Myotis davidii]
MRTQVLPGRFWRYDEAHRQLTFSKTGHPTQSGGGCLGRWKGPWSRRRLPAEMPPVHCFCRALHYGYDWPQSCTQSPNTDPLRICDPVPCHEEEEDEEVEDQDDDDEDSDEEEDEDDEVVDEEVNVDFEAYSISDNDYDGIKKLLQQLFLKAPVNTAELTNLLIQQNHIGSVIKQTDASEDSDDDVDEDEIFGFISLLNLTERKGTQCAEQIKELTLSGCAKSCEKSVVEQLDKLFNDPARPVYWGETADLCVSCRKELAEAHKTNKPCGKCHFYLLISKTFAEAGKGNSQKKQSSQKKDELMFANAEEEFFYEKAVLTFSYSVQEESDSCLGGRWSFDDVPMKPLRTVMLVPCDRMGEIMAALEEHLSV